VRFNGGWKGALSRAVVDRAQRSLEAIDHETRVYFPNRSHATRIAVKKLRYVLELATATGLRDFSEAVRESRKSQNVLGDLHDQQGLAQYVSSRKPTDDRDQNAIDLIRQVVDGEIQRLHSRYLSPRESLQRVLHSVCGFCESGGWTLPSLVTAGVVALSSGAFVVHRQSLRPNNPS
jgi:CHAD domain-containing protein